MKIAFRKSEITLLLAWLLAALSGRAVYLLLVESLYHIPYVLAALSGLTRSIPQWLTLRPVFKRADLWGLITFAGITVNALLVEALDTQIQTAFVQIQFSILNIYLFLIAVQAVQGALIGFFQWLALRMEVWRAGHWVWIMALANALSTLFNLAYLFTLLNTYGAPSNVAPYHDTLRQLLTSGINALVSGLGLVWLLRRPIEDNADEDAYDEDTDDQEMEDVGE